MPRQRRLLADLNPELADIYHPDNPVPFDEVPLNSSGKFLWRCRHRHDGHVWEETASARRSLKPAWKAEAGGTLACPWCERLWVKLACGHVRRCQPGEQIDDTQDCSRCRRAADPVAQAADRERAYWAAHEAEVKAAVAELETELPAIEGPDVLAHEVRYRRRGLLQKAVYARAVHDTPEEAPGWVAAAAQLTVDDVMPAIESCRGRTVVPLTLRKSAWGPGLAHHLGDRPPPATMPDGFLEHLAETLRAVIDANGGTPDTAILTHGVRYWSRLLSGEDPSTWVRFYGELTVPVLADGDSNWGRLDAVLSFPSSTGVADVAVEIDQTNKQRSVAKLTHVRDAGGLPIWVRWGQGPIDAPEWLPVIDLR